MTRPKKQRRIYSEPAADYFKPRGIPLRALEHIRLSRVELEALRFADLEGMKHEEAAKLMEISRQTFGRVLKTARKITADALVTGKAIKIEGGEFVISGKTFRCVSCDYIWTADSVTGAPSVCAKCGSSGMKTFGSEKGA